MKIQHKKRSRSGDHVSKRIEPHFGKPAKPADGIRVERSDRVVANASGPTKTRKSAKKKPPKTTAPAARKRTKRKPRRKQSWLGYLLRGTFYWGAVASIWGVLIVGVVIGYYAAKLPQSTHWSVPERPPNARIVAANGSLIANRGATGGESMLIGEMSPYLPLAVIAIEDHRFQSHFGFDPIGFTRAMARNVMEGRLVQGGSTLTQQLAKNLFLKPERTFQRKVQELILAVWLETKFTKDEILELYLNRVYFGSGAYGVDAASRRYFQKSARDLTLAESALLAGVLKAPSVLSPAKNPRKADDRAQLVLAAMKREGFITARETTKALSMQASKAKKYWSGSEHYVADLVLKEIEAVYGKLNQDVIVDTTLDQNLQKVSAREIRTTLDRNGKKLRVSQGATVTMDGNGGIRALVGGREYADSQFNRVTDAKRQPGSGFKPFVFLAALELGRTPDSVRNDAPVKIGNWSPKNYDKRYRGPVTLDVALTHSLNTVAAQLTMESGPKRVVATAKRMGIKSKLDPNASIALGTSEVTLNELTGAYVPFANGGYRVTPYLVKRIKSLDGKILYERPASSSEKVVGDRELGMMNAMLGNVVRKGTGKAAALRRRQAAGKTGTTQNSRDALFVGYTANLVTGVWYGNDNGKPMKKVTGGSLPAKSWASIMTAAHDGLPQADLPGNYIATINVIPTPRPRRSVDQQKIANGAPEITRFAEQQTTSSNAPRPQAGVGNNGGDSGKKPKSIMDILFGG